MTRAKHFFFLSILCLAFAMGAQAERGRGIVLRVPNADGIDNLAREWNSDLGRNFDLVAFSPSAGQTVAAVEPFMVGVKAVFVEGVAGAQTAVQGLNPAVEWLIVDMRSETSPQREAIEAMQSSLHATQRFLAVIPPEASALDWASALAPHVSAYFVPVSELTPEGLRQLQLTAYTATQANGRCGIGSMIDASAIGSTDEAQPILDFVNATDEFIKFFAIEWPADPETIASLIGWLNPRIEGPKASLGMHQDRLRPPERKLDPEVEAKLMRWMGIVAAVFFVIAVLVLFVWFKPVTRMPPDNS